MNRFALIILLTTQLNVVLSQSVFSKYIAPFTADGGCNMSIEKLNADAKKCEDSYPNHRLEFECFELIKQNWESLPDMAYGSAGPDFMFASGINFEKITPWIKANREKVESELLTIFKSDAVKAFGSKLSCIGFPINNMWSNLFKGSELTANDVAEFVKQLTGEVAAPTASPTARFTSGNACNNKVTSQMGTSPFKYASMIVGPGWSEDNCPICKRVQGYPYDETMTLSDAEMFAVLVENKEAMTTFFSQVGTFMGESLAKAAAEGEMKDYICNKYTLGLPKETTIKLRTCLSAIAHPAPGTLMRDLIYDLDGTFSDSCNGFNFNTCDDAFFPVIPNYEIIADLTKNMAATEFDKMLIHPLFEFEGLVQTACTEEVKSPTESPTFLPTAAPTAAPTGAPVESSSAVQTSSFSALFVVLATIGSFASM